MKPAIYKVGYKSGGSPQHIRMITDRKSPLVHCPAIHNRAKGVINISDGDSDVAESTTESDTEPEHYSPENQLGLPENRAWVDRRDVSEASSKHWFDCRLINGS